MKKNEVSTLQIILRIAIILIVIILLFAISFAMVRFVPKVLSSLSNLRNIFPGKEKIILSLDEDQVSKDEEAILYYRQKGGKGDGFYTLSYSCSKIESHTDLEIRQSANSEVIGCETPIHIGLATTSPESQTLAIGVISDSVTYDQPITLTVKHVNGSTTVASASLVLTYLKDSRPGDEVTTSTTDTSKATTTKSTTETKPVVEKPKTTPTPKPTQSTQTSPADLSITLGNVTVNSNGRANLSFNVTNRGGRNSGAWRFHATIPRSSGQTVYDSPLQSSIPAGKTSVMYFGFDNAEAGTITISVDYYNQISESNEGNNSASAVLR